MITKHTKLKEVLEIGKACDRCGHCCKFGSGLLIASDIKPIAKLLKMKQTDLKETFLNTTQLFNTVVFKTKQKDHMSPCAF